MDSTTDAFLAFKENNQWISRNLEELKKRYDNLWVAVLNKTVVDKDSDLRKLVERLKTSYSKVYGEIAVEYIGTEELDAIPSNTSEQ